MGSTREAGREGPGSGSGRSAGTAADRELLADARGQRAGGLAAGGEPVGAVRVPGRYGVQGHGESPPGARQGARPIDRFVVPAAG
jgi:hypothetical protein